jgi:hypothetical protein
MSSLSTLVNHSLLLPTISVWAFLPFTFYLVFIIRMIKPRSMRYVGLAARMGKKKNAYKISVG